MDKGNSNGNSTPPIDHNLIFKNDLDAMILRAESELARLGFPEKSWKKLLPTIDLKIGVHCVAFNSSSEINNSFGISAKSNPEPRQLEAGLYAMKWAEAAAIAFLAKDNTSSRESFALGYSYFERMSFLSQQIIVARGVDRTDRKRGAKAGLKRRGKFAPIKQLIVLALDSDAGMNFQKLKHFFKKEDALERLLEQTGLVDVQVEDDNEQVVYKIESKTKKIIEKQISFDRIRNILSELKKSEK